MSLQPALDHINAEAHRRGQNPTVAEFDIRPDADGVGAWMTATFSDGSMATGYAPDGMRNIKASLQAPQPNLTAITGGKQ